MTTVTQDRTVGSNLKDSLREYAAAANRDQSRGNGGPDLDDLVSLPGMPTVFGMLAPITPGFFPHQ